MLIKVHKSYRDVVAICDKKLLGKKFKEDKFQLDIKNNFFGGDENSEEKIIELIQHFKKEDATFNIIGEKSTDCAIKAGIAKKENIRKIQGIPFVLVLL